MKTSAKILIFKGADEKEHKFTVNEKGQLMPYVEEEIQTVTKTPWKASNDVLNTCKFLGLSRGTVMKLISLGELKAVKAGKRWIIPGWAIEQFLQQPMHA
ncbi:hypothetical protein SPFL3102_02667 [Sporomusaceae bacterium FL31]|nr:hypothetical protein SPFL3101_02642 [Sporomusaceae bacterium FL31]GCE34840.1 hypothetical protein SPFL3102_02667 [Sporomusaceae bacterium]